jgi:hypothetical protein
MATAYPVDRSRLVKLTVPAKVLGQANRAIALAPDNMRAYWVKCEYLNTSRRPNESLAAANTGLAINPKLRAAARGAR